MKYEKNNFQIVQGLKLEIELDDEDIAKLLRGSSIDNDDNITPQNVLFTIRRKE